jgi:hypothetical protein
MSCAPWAAACAMSASVRSTVAGVSSRTEAVWATAAVSFMVTPQTPQWGMWWLPSETATFLGSQNTS